MEQFALPFLERGLVDGGVKKRVGETGEALSAKVDEAREVRLASLFGCGVVCIRFLP